METTLGLLTFLLIVAFIPSLIFFLCLSLSLSLCVLVLFFPFLLAGFPISSVKVTKASTTDFHESTQPLTQSGEHVLFDCVHDMHTAQDSTCTHWLV